MSTGWIGVDLDGTLAEYHGWVAPDEIGAPVPAMLDRVKVWLSEGRDVRIFTARAFEPDWEPPDTERHDEVVSALRAIRKWCLKHLGRELPVTCTKDLSMIELWDDRCVQVEINTGRRVDGK